MHVLVYKLVHCMNRAAAAADAGGDGRGARLIASQTQRTAIMKTATFPSLRVEAELREAAESVLREGETLTSLIESAMRETIHRRRVQDEFLARGLRSSEDAKRTGIYHAATKVHTQLQRRLDARRKRVLG